MSTALSKFAIKLILLLLSLYIVHFTFYITPAHAQEASASSTSKESKPTFEVSQTLPLPSYIPQTSPAYTDLMVFNMFHTFSCLAVGGSIIGQPCVTYQLQKNAQGALQGVPVLSSVNLGGGALSAVTSVIGALYDNQPVRTADYLASVGTGLGIVKEAHAQVGGSGNAVLSPILSLWQVSRNITYLAMILIFVTIGIMVMFRQRINPQTVITAQSALPGLVIGLILITFSYFFAALLTDTAFVGTNIVGYYFSTAKNTPAPGNPNQPPCPGANANSLVDCAKDDNALTIMGRLMGGITKDEIASGLGSVFNHLTGQTQMIVRTMSAIAAYQVGNAIGPAIGSLIAMTGCGIAGILAAAGVVAVGAPVIAPIGFLALPVLPAILIPAGGTIAGGVVACSAVGAQTANIIGGPIIGGALAGVTALDPPAYIGFALWVIAIAVIVYTMFKLLFRLINSFLQIIFLTITAPFHFLVASLPGRQGIATSWILNMLCNIMAFPAVMAVFYFINFLLGSVNISNTPFQIGGEPALTGSGTLPLFGGLTIPINILLAFGALIATPAIPDIICKTIGREGPAGQMLGQAISGNIGAGRGYFNQAQQGVGKIAAQVDEFRSTPGYLGHAEIDAAGQATGRVIANRDWEPTHGAKVGKRAMLGH